MWNYNLEEIIMAGKRGCNHHHKRLSAELAELIRFEYENDETTNPVNLAIKYNTSYKAIRDVLAGRTFNVSGKIKPIKRRFDTHMTYKGCVCVEDLRTEKKITFKNYECALIFLKEKYPDINGNEGQLKRIRRKLMTYDQYRDYKFVPVENGGRVPAEVHYGYTCLNDRNVKEIRDLYFNDGWTVKDLAKKYGKSWTTIEGILKGKTYRDVGGMTSSSLILNRNRRGNKSLKGVPLVATNVKTGQDLYFNDIGEAAEAFLKFANTTKMNVRIAIYHVLYGRNKTAYGYTWQKL